MIFTLNQRNAQITKVRYNNEFLWIQAVSLAFISSLFLLA